MAEQEPKKISINKAREAFIDSLVKNALHDITTKSVTKKQAVVSAVFGVLATLEGASDFPFCMVIPTGGLSRDGKKRYPSRGELLRGEDHHMFTAKLFKAYKEKTGEEFFTQQAPKVARKRRSK